MAIGMTPDEDLEQYDDIDRFDDPRLNLRDGGTDLFRAVIVLLVAAAVGALILTQGFDGATDTSDDQDSAADSIEADESTTDTGAASDDPAAPEADGVGDDAMADDAMADGTATTTSADATAATDPSTADGTETGSTTSTLALSEGSVARPPQEVEVLVLNATDRKGIAAQASELLQTSNYNTAPAGNATISGMGSVIYYMEGYRADAIAIAEVFTDGLDGLVQPYDLSNPPTDEIGGANVIVVLGVDEAIPIG